MANSALAVLESALRDRKLDQTLTTALSPLVQGDDSCAPTGVATIDACLRNGVPRGQLSELAGPRSSGRTTLLLQMMAAATGRGELAVLVDTFDRLDVASAAAAGADLDRLLWIRGQALSAADGATDGDRASRGERGKGSVGRIGGPVEWAVDRALKALNLVLQAGGFGFVAIDLADVPAPALRRLPFTTWLRVQRAVEGRDTACVLVTPEPLARSAGGLTLTLTSHTAWTGSLERPRVTGADVRLRVVSPRRRVGGEVAMAARAVDVAAGL
jgi:recombination protein RecA